MGSRPLSTRGSRALLGAGGAMIAVGCVLSLLSAVLGMHGFLRGALIGAGLVMLAAGAGALGMLWRLEYGSPARSTTGSGATSGAAPDPAADLDETTLWLPSRDG